MKAFIARLTPLHFYASLVLAFAIVLGYTVLMASAPTVQSERKPGIKFSHKLHVQDNGVACQDCHTKPAESTLASDNLRPNHDNCQSCHEEAVNENCNMCHLTDPSEYEAAPAPVREIRFSHKFHLDNGAQCETCHTDMAKVEEVGGNHVPTMSTCNTCHNDVKAPNACESCHTNLASLRPASHNQTNHLLRHKEEALQPNATCNSCHTEESCQDCHNGAELVSVDVPGSDLQVPHAPRLFSISRGQDQKNLKVHDATFRFSHGAVAQAKTLECQTCHEEQTFCVTCHQSGGNINQAAFRPSSHNQAGFVTLGRGSGGGIHALMAKRDIETCAACHDEEGADPTCILCHVDRNPGKGNDYRTHEPGFMADTHGSWHDDPGANCYMCHIDSNARPGGIKGQLFCGYCHS